MSIMILAEDNFITQVRLVQRWAGINQTVEKILFINI